MNFTRYYKWKPWQNLLNLNNVENPNFSQSQVDETVQVRIINGRIIVQNQDNTPKPTVELTEKTVSQVKEEPTIKRKTGRPVRIDTIKNEFFQSILGRLPSTVRQYRLDFHNFELFLTETGRKIHYLSVLDLESYVTWQRSRKCGEQIIRRRLCFLSILAKFLRGKDLNWLKVDGINRPKIFPRITRCLEPQVFETLLLKVKEAVEKRERAAIWAALMAVCGFKISEIPTAQLNGSKWLVKNRGEQERWVPCPTWLRVNYERKGCNTIRTTVKTWLRQSGIEINPCGLRHSCATYLLYKGVSLEYVRKILGHKDIRTTEKYLHLETTKCLDFWE